MPGFSRQFDSSRLRGLMIAGLAGACGFAWHTGATQGGLAETTWPSLYADAQNTNGMPYVAPKDKLVRWSTLTGAAVAAGPAIDEDGFLWVTTGQGQGSSCLHRLDKNGNQVWSADVYRRLSDLDSYAVMSSPRIDDDGTVYVTDSDQLWAFQPDGVDASNVSQKWVVELPEVDWPAGAQYSVFFVDDYVGLFALPGTVALYDRGTGELAMPVLELPGELSVVEDVNPDHHIQLVADAYDTSGLLDPEVVADLLGEDTGVQWVLSNAPAVHPQTGRIFISGVGSLAPDGTGTSVLYVVELSSSGTYMEIAGEKSLGRGSRASPPAITPDGSQVVMSGDDATIYAFDAYSLAERWRWDPGEARSSAPITIGPEGTIYCNLVDYIVALEPDDGSERWRRDFQDIADQMLTLMMNRGDLTRDPMFTSDGMAIVTHVLSASAGHVIVAPVLGYGVDGNPRDANGNLVPTPEESVILSLTAEKGKIEGWPWVIPEVADGHIVLDTDGNMYVTHLGALSTLFYYGMGDIVPSAVQVDAPIGGITAVEPALYKEISEDGLVLALELNETAAEAAEHYADMGDESSLGRAIDTLEMSLVQIDASGLAVAEPRAAAELCGDEISEVQRRLYGSGTGGAGALDDVRTARDALAQSRPDVSRATQYLGYADEQLSAARAAIPVHPLVDTAGYSFEGTETKDGMDDVTERFLGIRYGRPPTGDLRWARPLPQEYTAGENYLVQTFGSACVQVDGTGEDVTVRGDEDCLFLNVFRPKPQYCDDKPDELLPVMAFIHGGGFINGDAEKYNGFRLASRGDVVLVTLQYRIGPLGFLALPELREEDPDGSTGNYGHLDLLLALEWIHDHIADFGGDPNNVTLFGQSAGAAITCSLAASPLSEELYGHELFHKAIIQSGFCAAALVMGDEDSTDVDTAVYRSKQVVDAVEDCPECSDPETRLPALRAKDAGAIALALNTVSQDSDPFYTFPAIDDYYLDDIPAVLIRDGASRGRPIIIGSMQDEGSPIAAPYFASITTWSKFNAQLEKVVGKRLARRVVTPLYREQFDDPTLAYRRLWEDFIFNCSTPVNARHFQSGGSDTYVYHFYADPKSESGPSFGAFHGLDVYYIWGYEEVLDERMGPIGQGDYDLIDILLRTWTGFAHTGVASTSPAWPNAHDRLMTFDVVGQEREQALLEIVSTTDTSFRGGRCTRLEDVFAAIDDNEDDLPDISIFRLLKPE